MDKKDYRKPELVEQKLELGVYGDYSPDTPGTGPSGPIDPGGKDKPGDNLIPSF